MGMAIPPAPWSPRPRILSLSVTTMSRTSSYGPWRRRVGIRSRSAGVIQVPRVRRMMWLNSWTARPDRRRVDDRQELLEVLREEPVEEGRVAVLERGHPDVALERVVLVVKVLELELDLLVDGQDAVGKQAAQPERVALLLAEGEVLGEQPAAEERRSRQRDGGWPSGRDVVDTGRGGDASSARIAGGARTLRSAPDRAPSIPTIS